MKLFGDFGIMQPMKLLLAFALFAAALFAQAVPLDQPIQQGNITLRIEAVAARADGRIGYAISASTSDESIGVLMVIVHMDGATRVKPVNRVQGDRFARFVLYPYSPITAVAVAELSPVSVQHFGEIY